MNIARGSIDRPLYVWLLILGSLLGGIWGFNSLGRLEDPAFTIKQAIVLAEYPGASAAQVAREVAEPLESEIQKMAEVNRITSVSQPGGTRIDVEIKATYGGDALPQLWDKLRARVDTAARGLPTGVGVPFVNDGFGDVFGIYYAVTAEGFTDAEKHALSRFLRREILAVDGVADVSVEGLPEEAIFIEPDMTQSVNLGVPPEAIVAAVSTADSVTDAGTLRHGDTRTIIERPEGSDSVSEIAGLTVGVGGGVVNLFDISTVSRGRVVDPGLIVRHGGVEAFTLGVAGLASEDIVQVGKAVDARLATLVADLPYGVDLLPIYQQHEVVEAASNDFLVNLAMSVGIVVAVLALFMGWRAALVVGVTLLLTVVGTLFFMAIFSIEMERISLGALIIAMGMLVDNAIVVAEGMQIAMQRGKTSREAADEAAGKTQIPLLGATVIGIMAFAGIGLSPDSTGEFLFSLFAVIGISLTLSWVLALTVTPLLGHYVFRQGAEGGEDAYGGLLFRAYGALLRGALRVWWLVIPGLVAITVLCFMGFGQIKNQFFPNSNTPLFFVHLKLPQGTPIQTTSERLAQLETWLKSRDDVVAQTAYVGQGATRFMLTYESQRANPSYGHLIVRTPSLDVIPALADALLAHAAEALPDAEVRVKRLVFGPGGGTPVAARFSGADPDVLRSLADEAMARMAAASDNLLDLRTDWRERELVLVPRYATDRAQTAGVTRDNVADAYRFATDGLTSGIYREGERLIPIITRVPAAAGLGLGDQVIYVGSTGRYIPVEQVTDGFAVKVEDTLFHRRDRVPTITVGADVPGDLTASEVFNEVRATVEAIPLPPGYRLEWGGEFESSGDAQESLAQQLPLSLIVMLLISILLFNALRQPLVIWLLVPMSVNGVVIGLLGTGLPFTFTALLGLLSLSGMLIKNGIVLVEEIDLVRAEGLGLRDAIVTACVSRLRPVILAAATTILGMIPLLGDAFFVSMAVTIMGGLAFASVLTLIAAPVFYYVFFIRADRPA